MNTGPTAWRREGISYQSPVNGRSSLSLDLNFTIRLSSLRGGKEVRLVSTCQRAWCTREAQYITVGRVGESLSADQGRGS